MTNTEQRLLLNWFHTHVPGLEPAIKQGFEYIEEQERLFNLEFPRDHKARYHAKQAEGAEWVLANLLRAIGRM